MKGIDAHGFNPNFLFQTPEFLSMNPAHTIPTMKDGDFVLTQSRAMVTYLVISLILILGLFKCH